MTNITGTSRIMFYANVKSTVLTTSSTVPRLDKTREKSGCICQPAHLHYRIIMSILSIAFLHWFVTFQIQTSSTVMSDSIFQGLVYSNFLPPLFNPSIVDIQQRDLLQLIVESEPHREIGFYRQK